MNVYDEVMGKKKPEQKTRKCKDAMCFEEHNVGDAETKDEKEEEKKDGEKEKKEGYKEEKKEQL